MKNIQDTINTIFTNKNATIKTRLLGGMMNETYIISSNEKDYVLFVPQGNANDVVDREEEKFVQNIASNLGITSKNIYFNVESGIKCHEFIEGSSLNLINDFDYEPIAKMLKIFHSSKTLSHYDYCPFDKLDGYLNQVLSFTTLGNDFYSLLNVLKESKDFLMSQKKTLCHNDFQKSNVVKTSDNNYYMIDFEFVANNDPIYDIAAFGNNSVPEGRKLLDAYFGSPTQEEIKRFYLWRVFISLQWSLMALIKDHNGEGKIHNIDFMSVSKFFLENAKEARGGLANGN